MARGAHLPLIRTGTVASGYDQKLSTTSSKHKVVLESVTQEKKKLRSVLSFKAEPPKGYTFIPAGNPELTNALKEFARKGSYEIYAVSVSAPSMPIKPRKMYADARIQTTPHQRTHDLSQQVHRIGFHFPSVVVAQVCAYYGIVLTSAGTVLVEDEIQSFHPRSKRLKEQAAAQERKDQITINTEARDTIKDLFPNIPGNDLNQIIKTAFQKGQGKVGTANELSLIRRAQLAVVAHIRHVYTDYDKLLRQTHYRDARNLVEKPSLRKLVEWRGDDENGKQVLEDVFREVVVISDDEDSDEEEDEATNNFRDVSVEIVSSNTKADHLNPDPLGLEDPGVGRRPDAGNRKRPLGYKHVTARARKERRNDEDKVSRRGFSRYQAWNEAREEFRANPSETMVADERALAYSAPELSFRRPDAGSSASGHQPEGFAYSHRSYHYQDIPMNSHNDSPDTFRAQDGTLYERVVKYPSTVSQPPFMSPLTYETRNSVTADKSRTNDVADTIYRQNRGQGLDFQRESILPSVEDSQLAATSSQRRVVSVGQTSLPSISERRGITTNEYMERHVDDIEFLNLTNEIQFRKKRRRIDDISSEDSKIARTGNVQREPEYISLVSPTDQGSHPSNPSTLLITGYQDSHGPSKALSFMPKYHETQDYSSPTSVTHSDKRLGARRPAGRPSSLSHFSSHEVLHPATSSPRIDGQFIPSHLHSALPGSATSTDRGIQQYRAFRARERQQREIPSPSGRGRPHSHENEDLNDAPTKPMNGRFRQYHEAASSRGQPRQLPLRRFVQNSLSVDKPPSLLPEDEHRLTREREIGRDYSVRCRSASPAQYTRRGQSYVPALPETPLKQQHEIVPEYPSMDLSRVAPCGEQLDPMIVRPTIRYREETNNTRHYLPITYEDRPPRYADL